MKELSKTLAEATLDLSYGLNGYSIKCGTFCRECIFRVPPRFFFVFFHLFGSSINLNHYLINTSSLFLKDTLDNGVKSHKILSDDASWCLDISSLTVLFIAHAADRGLLSLPHWS